MSDQTYRPLQIALGRFDEVISEADSEQFEVYLFLRLHTLRVEGFPPPFLPEDPLFIKKLYII